MWRVSAMDETPRAGVLTEKPSSRRLVFVWLELTHQCNLRCRHCYASCTDQEATDSLPASRWRSLLEEAAACGASAVQLTGGEPTTHPEVLPLLAHGRDLGLAVEIFTNAALLEERDLDRIAELGADVATSLYSHIPEVHDGITDVAGSHAATLRSIRGLISRQVEVRVATVLMASNAGHEREVARLVRDIGVLAPHKTDEVRPTGRGRAAAPPGTEPSWCGGLSGSALQALHAPGHTPPTCWDGRLAISPDGDVMPCIFARDLRVGSVANDSLSSILAGKKLLDLWRLTLDDVEECRDCHRKNLCFDCRALPFSVHGDLKAKTPRCGYVPSDYGDTAPPATSVRLRPDIATAKMGDELFLLDPETARLHRLNLVASTVLDGLAGGASRETIASELAHEYRIPFEQALEDVTECQGEMAQAGFLEPMEKNEPAPPDPRDHGAPETPGPGHEVRSSALDASVASDGKRSLLVCAGTRVGLEAPPDLLDALSSFFSSLIPARCTDEDWKSIAPSRRITIVTRRPSARGRPLHHLFRGHVRMGTARTLEALRAELETLICTLAAEEEPDEPGVDASLSLHAAALAGPRGAVVIPAAHGAGKSLLAAWGKAAGLVYLGDEVARVVRRSDGLAVLGLPKPIKLKPDGFSLSPDELDPAFVGPKELRTGKLGWLLAEGDSRSFPLAGLVRIERRGGSPMLEPSSPAEMVETLLAQSFNIRALGPREALDAACAIAGTAPSHVLDSTDLRGAAVALLKLLSTGPL